MNIDHVRAVMGFGFTERQARFLVLVMRLAGVCLPRQYAQLSGIANGGKKCNAFFAKLLTRGHASAVDCLHNRARLYHLHSKALYQAIGEPNSRYRRPVAARQVVERLMLLDALLDSPDLKWLVTDAEKVAYASSLTAAKHDRTPVVAAAIPPSPSRRDSGSTFPIGIDQTGRVLLLYVTRTPSTEGFRQFLQDHVTLMRAMPHWTLRVAFPRPLDCFRDAYHSVIREELEILPAARISELKWYFAHRQRAAESRSDAMTQALVNHGSQVFSAPRFTMLYRRWLKHGDATFETLSSSVISEALKAGTARVEPVVLPHAYRHLSPLLEPDQSHASGG